MLGDVMGRVTFDASGRPYPGRCRGRNANDKAVEMLGAGSLGDTTALISLGTYIAAMVHGHENHRDPANFWTNFACIEPLPVREHGVRRGMWTLTWFLDLLGPEVAERAASSGLSREHYIEREADSVPAGSDGLMTVLDWLAPTDRPFRKGVMLGFDARHTRGHLYRSILEAIAMTMKHHVDAMCAELGIVLDEIVVSGGGSESPLFMQIFADVFGIPASRTVDAGGASLGAAICAAAAAGIHPDIEAAASAMAKGRQSFAPDAANTTVYSGMNERHLPAHSRGHRPAPRAGVPAVPLTCRTSPNSPTRTRHMTLTRAEIVEQLQQIVGEDQILTDADLLRQRSIDNFRKLENIFGAYTMPAPAAIVMVRSTERCRGGTRLRRRAPHQRGAAHRRHGDRRRTRDGGREPIVLDGSLMNQIISVDAYNMQATAQCGVPLQVLEDRARRLGLTTGHSPQSKPVAQLGGLVATRSIGQFSTLYGGIEDMVVGLEVVFPGGQVSRIKNVPRRVRRARHPTHRDRQRGCALLHHRGHRQTVPVSAREQHVPRLDPEGHADRIRGAARGDGRRLPAVRRPVVRP